MPCLVSARVDPCRSEQARRLIEMLAMSPVRLWGGVWSSRHQRRSDASRRQTKGQPPVSRNGWHTCSPRRRREREPRGRGSCHSLPRVGASTTGSSPGSLTRRRSPDCSQRLPLCANTRISRRSGWPVLVMRQAAARLLFFRARRRGRLSSRAVAVRYDVGSRSGSAPLARRA